MRLFGQFLSIFAEVGRHGFDSAITLLSMARLLAVQRKAGRAVELLTLVVQHPATPRVYRDQAEHLLADLQADLAPDVFTAASERGQALEFEEVVAALLGTPESTPLRHTANRTLTEPLSEREREILRLIADGLSNAEIAQRLYLAVGTVKVHARNIYAKLGVRGRTEAVVQAQKLSLL